MLCQIQKLQRQHSESNVVLDWWFSTIAQMTKDASYAIVVDKYIDASDRH